MSGPQLSGDRQVATPVGAGIGVSAPLTVDLDERLRIGLDVDALLAPDVTYEPGPSVSELDEGAVWWITASLAYRLQSACERVCAEVSVSGGFTNHPYEYDVLLDDIVVPVDDQGWRPSAGVGLELWFPSWIPELSLTLDDRVTWPDSNRPSYDDAPMQALVVGVGWTW